MNDLLSMARLPIRWTLIFLIFLYGALAETAQAERDSQPFYEKVTFPPEIKHLEPALRKLSPKAWVHSFQETLDYRDMKSKAWLVTFILSGWKHSYTYDYAYFSDRGELLTLFSRDLPDAVPPKSSPLYSTPFSSNFPQRAIMMRLNDTKVGAAFFTDSFRPSLSPVPQRSPYQNEETFYDYRVYEIVAGKGRFVFKESLTFHQTLKFDGWLKFCCFVDLDHQGQMDLLIERRIQLHEVNIIDRSVYHQNASGLFEKAPPALAEKGLDFLQQRKFTQHWSMDNLSWSEIGCPYLKDDDSYHN